MTNPDPLLEKAGRSLDAAELLLKQGSPDFAASRTYYGYLDPSFHRLLDSAFGLRQLADYQVEVEIESEIVEDLIVGGRSFLQAAASYLSSLPEPRSGGGNAEA